MPIAMDFGTCNTVMARWNEEARRADLIQIPGLSRKFIYRLPGHAKDLTANVIPTLIHYGEKETRLLGQQVADEGLINHAGSFRWVKLDLLRGNNKARRVNGSLRRPLEAASDFVTNTLTFALGAMGGADEELVITVPVEAFDPYVNWLRTTVESVAGGRRVRMLDEATASLDAETEREVTTAIHGLRGEKTLIIITHRLSTIEGCDVVYELTDGRVTRVERSVAGAGV